MAGPEQNVTLEIHRFTRYALRIVPLWDGEIERIELGSDLQALIDRVVRERSVGELVGQELKPMRFCQFEEEEAIYLPAARKTFYSKELSPVWKIMVPSSGIYRREMIVSCMDRGAGRNIEKYRNVLYHYPQAAEFYTYSGTEIRPVDDTVFVIEPPAR